MFVLSKPVVPGRTPAIPPSVIPIPEHENGGGYLLFASGGVDGRAPGSASSGDGAGAPMPTTPTATASADAVLDGAASHHATSGAVHVLADALSQMVWVSDPAGNCEFVNRPWLEYTGGAFHDQLGWGWTDAIHPDDRPRLGEFWASALSALEPGRTEGRIRRYDGEFRWFEVRATPSLAADGSLIGWCGALADIHEAYALRRALTDRDAQIDGAVAGGNLATYSFQFDSREFACDPQLADLLGTSTKQLADLGFESFAEVVHPEDKVSWQLGVGRAFDVATPEFSVRFRAPAPDGGWRWVAGRGRVSFDRHDRALSVAGIVSLLPPGAGPALD